MVKENFVILAEKYDRKAKLWSQTLNLEIISNIKDAKVNFVIKFLGEDIILIDKEQKLELKLDFTILLNSFRAKRIASENLIKALGKIPKDAHIYDLTGGFGRDSCLMALRGHKVTMIEKQPIIAKLVADSLEKINLDIGVINADSIEFIKKLPSGNIFYLDPMFPKRKNKNAKVKKDLQFLQNICDDKDNAYELVTHALEKGKVILKRPISAKIFSDLKPNYVILGERIRFEVFL